MISTIVPQVVQTSELPSNCTSCSHPNTSSADQPHRDGRPLRGEVTIPLYSIIFCLAAVGNLLVILTLAQNKRMRTITNVFLLNLSVSDLLLAVFCMPFTLIPTLMQDFIFGTAMCILIRYMQGVSVGVCVFTLVTISLERYFAICQPLRSRRWQTLEHSYRTIVCIWFVSLVIMIPIAVCQKVVELKQAGAHKCVEVWRDRLAEMVFTIFLDVVLLVVPMTIMLCAYGRISATLYQGIQLTVDYKNSIELRHLSTCDEVDTDDDSRYTAVNNSAILRSGSDGYNVITGSSQRKSRFCNNEGSGNSTIGRIGSCGTSLRGTQSGNGCNGGSGRMERSGSGVDRGGSGGGGMAGRRSVYYVNRQEQLARSVCAKRRSIKMLFAVVLEFFVCWTPLYVIQTWRVFDDDGAQHSVSASSMNLIHLLAFASSCSNPITYCFMSKRFRQCFIWAVCRCCRCSARYPAIDGRWTNTGMFRRAGSHMDGSGRYGHRPSNCRSGDNM